MSDCMNAFAGDMYQKRCPQLRSMEVELQMAGSIRQKLEAQIESLKRQIWLESQGKKFITICHHCLKPATKVVCVCEEHSQRSATVAGNSKPNNKRG